MLVLGTYSGVTFTLGKKVLNKPPVVGLETMVGTKAKATTPLSPAGYVLVNGQLWQACSMSQNLDRGTEVIVRDIRNLLFSFCPPLMSAQYRMGQGVKPKKG